MDFLNLSKRQKGYIIGGLLVVIILSWAYFSAGSLTKNFNRSSLIGTENRQELNVDGIILTETKDDIKYWEIYGETAIYNSDTKIALLNKVVGNFYNTDKEVTMSFESSKGTYNENNRQIILYDNTKVVIKDGTYLEADRLVWSGSDVDIIGQGNVKINRNNELVSNADKIIIRPDYSSFKIIGNSKTNIYNDKELVKKWKRY